MSEAEGCIFDKADKRPLNDWELYTGWCGVFSILYIAKFFGHDVPTVQDAEGLERLRLYWQYEVPDVMEANFEWPALSKKDVIQVLTRVYGCKCTEICPIFIKRSKRLLGSKERFDRFNLRVLQKNGTFYQTRGIGFVKVGNLEDSHIAIFHTDKTRNSVRFCDSHRQGTLHKVFFKKYYVQEAYLVTMDYQRQLQLAIKSSNTLKVENLLTSGARAYVRCKTYGWPLEVAVGYAIASNAHAGAAAVEDALCLASVAIVKALLEAGADPNVKDTFDKRPLLLQATSFGHVEVVRLLLDGGASGLDTALQVAAFKKYTDIMQVLRDHDADKNKCASGATPLNRAVQHESTEAADGHASEPASGGSTAP